ncbi:hypothetical protein KY359_03580 [Candidatus Woesearchaeota archaeon]|nr:hypothetical protein [Candidatus Woesearchaeota archaeon]
MKENKTFKEVLFERYRGTLVTGVILVAVSVWLYEYHYTQTGDGLVGMFASCSLFFGTLILGTGIRAWRDGDDYRNRYIFMKSRGGADVAIRKRKKGWFR